MPIFRRTNCISQHLVSSLSVNGCTVCRMRADSSNLGTLSQDCHVKACRLFSLRKIRGNLLPLSSENSPEDKGNYFSGCLVTGYQTTRRHVSENSTLYSKRCEKPLFSPNISVSVTLA